MQHPYNQFSFHPLEIHDRHLLEPILLSDPQNITGYTFACLMAWNRVFHYEWTLLSDKCLLFSFLWPEGNKRYLLQPIGEFTDHCQQKLLEQLTALQYEGRLQNVSHSFLEKHPDFVSRFEIINERGRMNYVYDAGDLATLPGRQYAKKRNLIRQASHDFPWSAMPLDLSGMAECIELVEKICFDKQVEKDQGLLQEWLALDFTLHHYEELGLNGSMIKSGDKVIAFSVFEESDPETAVVHFEKAFPGYKGLYQLVNQATSKMMLEAGYRYINREEDLDLPGLRKAKLSYYPVELRPAYRLMFRAQE